MTFVKSLFRLSILCATGVYPGIASTSWAEINVADQLSQAQAVDGHYIAWREHIIDDPTRAGFALSGSDGLSMADLDGDGYQDIVSVHESDTVYDGKPIGHVRIAWGSANPESWALSTLASGIEAAAAEDVAIADANGDGWPDIVVAAELAHLIYFQNPGENIRTQVWPRTIVPITTGRGSFIRVFFADLNNDGRPEVVAPNKGEQNPDLTEPAKHNISIYHLPEAPLQGELWTEQLLIRVRIPINAEPIDLDQDGDLDIVAGSRGEARILWLENHGGFNFVPHNINTLEQPADSALTGFNMDYADLNGDGRLDIVSTAWPSYLLLLLQPANPAESWRTSVIADIKPDQLVSVRLADIDGDRDLDAFVGSYSRGPRDADGVDVSRDNAVGRIAWLANPGPQMSQTPWPIHNISRRKRGMYDKWLAQDVDGDGDLDMLGTRGNSEPYDGVLWLEQVRASQPLPNFAPARAKDSQALPLPTSGR